MTINEFKQALKQVKQLRFVKPDGSPIPPHFHITEVGKSTKTFIDCGGKLRQEERITMQLYAANDTQHRLRPEKLLGILNLAQRKLNLGDLDVQLEAQGHTIGLYRLSFNGSHFRLLSTQTACLAEDACGISEPSETEIAVSTCQPGLGCC